MISCCSFCGKSESQVLLVQGPAPLLNICEECVEVCVYVLQDMKETRFRRMARAWYQAAPSRAARARRLAQGQERQR